MKKPNDLQIFSPQPAFQPPSEELASATSNPLSAPILILGERVINKLANAKLGINLPDFIFHFKHNSQFPTQFQKAATCQGRTAGSLEGRTH